jgi:hypothetical protein
VSGFGFERASLRRDFIRAAVGLALTGGGFLLADHGSVGQWVFGPIALVFLAFLLHTAVRRGTYYDLTLDGIRRSNGLGPITRTSTLAWRDLRRVSLRYFSTRRDRAGGWLQLTLAGSGTRFSLDSTLEGFDAVIAATATAIREHDISVKATTAGNFAALGQDLGRMPNGAGGTSEPDR